MQASPFHGSIPIHLLCSFGRSPLTLWSLFGQILLVVGGASCHRSRKLTKLMSAIFAHKEIIPLVDRRCHSICLGVQPDGIKTNRQIGCLGQITFKERPVYLNLKETMTWNTGRGKGGTSMSETDEWVISNTAWKSSRQLMHLDDTNTQHGLYNCQTLDQKKNQHSRSWWPICYFSWKADILAELELSREGQGWSFPKGAHNKRFSPTTKASKAGGVSADQHLWIVLWAW